MEHDDQACARREDRVQDGLAVIGARVGIQRLAATGEQVVTVAQAAAREAALVETDQADHLVRDARQVVQSGHHQGAVAERGPFPAPPPGVGPQRHDVGCAQVRGGGAASLLDVG